VVGVAGAERGRDHGLLVTRVRTEDGTDHAATDYFTPWAAT
jgi:methionyl-tRNA formyltransferase